MNTTCRNEMELRKLFIFFDLLNKYMSTMDLSIYEGDVGTVIIALVQSFG